MEILGKEYRIFPDPSADLMPPDDEVRKAMNDFTHELAEKQVDECKRIMEKFLEKQATKPTKEEPTCVKSS